LTDLQRIVTLTVESALSNFQDNEIIKCPDSFIPQLRLIAEG